MKISKLQQGSRIPYPKQYVEAMLHGASDTTSHVSSGQTTQQVKADTQKVTDLPRTRGEGAYRNIERRRRTGKTIAQEQEERAVQEARKPTWKADVADGLHMLGETAMSVHPLTSTTYFGAKALNDVIHGNANVGTAVDAGIAVMPWLRPYRAASAAASTVMVDNAKDKVVQTLNNLYDPYTTLGARQGFYSSNPFTNFWSTLARRYNLPDKARFPELIRKTNSEIQNVGKEVLISRPSSHARSTSKEFANITNFTYDRPVVSHSAGNWDGARVTYVVNPKSVINRGTFGSIEPSDAFLIDNGHLSIPAEDITVISGDVETLNKARSQGIKTLSSKKARRLYSEEKQKIADAEAKYHAAIEEAKKSEDIHRVWEAKFKKPYSGNFSEYAQEIERLQGLRGRPFMKDVRLLENKTGLNAGVTETNGQTPFMRQVATFLANPFSGKAPKYPNGRVFEADDPVSKGTYRYLFYDPSTHAESIYRRNLNK